METERGNCSTNWQLVFAFFAFQIVIVGVAIVEAREEGEEQGERDGDDGIVEVALGEPSHDGRAGGGVLDSDRIGEAHFDDFRIGTAQEVEGEKDSGEDTAFWDGGLVRIFVEEVVAFENVNVLVFTFLCDFEFGQSDLIEIGDAAGAEGGSGVGAEGVELEGRLRVEGDSLVSGIEHLKYERA